MQRIGIYAGIAMGLELVACVDAAETPFRVCESEAAKGNTKAAVTWCEQASSASPASKFGVMAATKRKDLQPALDKVHAEEKAAADKIAAAEKVKADAVAAEKAKTDAVAAKAAMAAREERVKGLRAKVRKKTWGAEPDGTCTGHGWPAYMWEYEGGTFAEDAELASLEGCVAAHTHSGNTTFCCPEKPVTLGW